jgi:aspartate/methionine/tyrosine aminotransferase
MRNSVVHPGSDKLTYEIREIVAVAKHLEKEGNEITWENIGDPVVKGETIPDWIKKIVTDAVQKDATYSYSPTQGVLEAREYIVKERNELKTREYYGLDNPSESAGNLSVEDILFYNGLGDAISHIYRNLHPNARVIGPSPAYPTHSSAEASHADKPHITYQLDPHNNWTPDFRGLEDSIKRNDDIVGILIVNPDNPTGAVFSPECMKKFVQVAKKYNLFIISDEIYSNLVYKGVDYTKLYSVVDDVPAIAMRGLSKEVPWPGARCGWVEFYNRDKDKEFDTYCESLIKAKMLEVCSTTLPQAVLPKIMSDNRYLPYLDGRTEQYQVRSEVLFNILESNGELEVVQPNGAFYVSILFKDQTIDDKAFVLDLLQKKGICTVPLSTGFNTGVKGFRVTLLEPDHDTFSEIIQVITDFAFDYCNSDKI